MASEAATALMSLPLAKSAAPPAAVLLHLPRRLLSLVLLRLVLLVLLPALPLLVVAAHLDVRVRLPPLLHLRLAPLLPPEPPLHLRLTALLPLDLPSLPHLRLAPLLGFRCLRLQVPFGTGGMIGVTSRWGLCAFVIRRPCFPLWWRGSSSPTSPFHPNDARPGSPRSRTHLLVAGGRRSDRLTLT